MRRAACSLLAAALGTAVTASTSFSAPPVRSWLSWTARRTASLELVAGYNGENNGFNFDGYGRGQLLVRMPLGWHVTVICRNAASMRHSCAIVRGPLTITPAFRGASTPSPTVGLRSGQTARFTFTAS